MAAHTTGETSLDTLLSTLTLTIHPGIYVFLTYASPTTPPPTLYQQLLFQEAEGLTVITTLASARDHSIPADKYTFACKMITCNVHSSLVAVGFMAQLAAVLAGREIPCNIVSGFFHDHLFVPEERAEEAMESLRALAEEAGSNGITRVS